MNLLGRATQAAEELDNRWTKDATIVELRTLVESAKIAKSEVADPEIARRIRARVDCRRRLALPAVDCTARKPRDCQCLTNALVELELFASPGLTKVSKADVLARSSEIHREYSKRNKPKLKPKPLPRSDVPPEMPPVAAQFRGEASPQSPEALPSPSPPKPRSRPVKRTPKWFDEDERSIVDRIF